MCLSYRGEGLLCILLFLLVPSPCAFEMSVIKSSGMFSSLEVQLKAGDSVIADPNTIVTRGMGLSVNPTTAKGGLLQSIKRRVLTGSEDEKLQVWMRRVRRLLYACFHVVYIMGDAKIVKPTYQPRRSRADGCAPPSLLSKQVISVSPGNEVTNCTLAPHFPGEIVLVTVGRPKRKHRARTGSHSINSGPSGSRSRVDGQAKEDHGPGLVLSKHAVIAASAGVRVTPSSGKGVPNKEARKSKAGPPHHLFEGHGSLALATFGQLKRFKLKSGERRAVSSSCVVGWRADTHQRAAPTPQQGLAIRPTTVFEGPGEVFVQTHSTGDFRRWASVRPVGFVEHGARGPGGRVSEGKQFGQSMSLSLKRGILKRGRAIAKRLTIALLLGTLYLTLYSVVTTLLLEGKDGLPDVPRHMLQVIKSLSTVLRKLATAFVRLTKEELWSESQPQAEVELFASDGAGKEYQ